MPRVQWRTKLIDPKKRGRKKQQLSKFDLEHSQWKALYKSISQSLREPVREKLALYKKKTPRMYIRTWKVGLNMTTVAMASEKRPTFSMRFSISPGPSPGESGISALLPRKRNGQFRLPRTRRAIFNGQWIENPRESGEFWPIYKYNIWRSSISREGKRLKFINHLQYSPYTNIEIYENFSNSSFSAEEASETAQRLLLERGKKVLEEMTAAW